MRRRFLFPRYPRRLPCASIIASLSFLSPSLSLFLPPQQIATNPPSLQPRIRIRGGYE